ncbi:hypothetical protein [Mucilaginibacter pedocola]|uniref:Uncharacterized protein n=1 Tax=Mucilaginibacter pedocola TaxID=1792845 RepID=A0A1S9PIP7_9SPHI|nr:hypothetical protein [Mucilaginibacter pedocola]OOQ60824.1 hypothetical protein BC343_22920 [Mucilaginibacter pedocola]
MAKWKIGVMATTVVVFDVWIYMAIGMAMMSYDDFYKGDPNEWGAWHTLSAFDKKVFTAWYIWHFVNLLGVGYILYRLITRWRNKTRPVKLLNNPN